MQNELLASGRIVDDDQESDLGGCNNREETADVDESDLGNARLGRNRERSLEAFANMRQLR